MKHTAIKLGLFVVFAAGLAWPALAGAAGIIVPSEEYPPPGGRYNSENTASHRTVQTEILSMSLTGSHGKPLNLLPPPGQTAAIDSFFDITYEIDFGGTFVVDSFFDITVRVEATGTSAGHWDTEILSMDLSGAAPPTGGPPLMIRESPSEKSTGETTLTRLPGGDFQVDSFFDVWTEVSVDGGQTWDPADQPLRMRLNEVVPEPATIALAALGVTGLAGYVRRRRRAVQARRAARS